MPDRGQASLALPLDHPDCERDDHSECPAHKCLNGLSKTLGRPLLISMTVSNESPLPERRGASMPRPALPDTSGPRQRVGDAVTPSWFEASGASLCNVTTDATAADPANPPGRE